MKVLLKNKANNNRILASDKLRTINNTTDDIASIKPMNKQHTDLFQKE